jgi:hypothetical protein
MRRFVNSTAPRISVLMSESVRKPCAMVDLNGVSAAARFASTWIHW